MVYQKKPTALKAPQSERTPSPMDLCTKEIPEEDKKKSIQSKKPIGSSISATPYDYYEPAKSRWLDDMRIMPAHQGDVNLSPTSNVHLSPTGFMSASTAIIQRSSMYSTNAMPVRDLSLKHPYRKFGDSPVVPTKFSISKRSGLEGFGQLTLQAQSPGGQIFNFGMKCKLEQTKITPFFLTK